MTNLVRLRIAGFKSFPDPVTLEVLPGLTGIVGPNGCGKSNVVEALRWAMGESSARAMRGGEMDDVIFAGTGARPSRNLAEVTVTLEPPLPEPYAAEPELQLRRRIERGGGSSFAANGRELRARDVQTLFADLATGARSSAMVSQGRVAALVAAKPEERRQVLEEAAGITGLHARRHEAELRLRATEQNLARSEDLTGQLTERAEALRVQAREAARFRAISGLIAAAQADFHGVVLGRAAAAAAAAEAALREAGEAQAARQAEAAAAESGTQAASGGLPALREAEAEARRDADRLVLREEALDREAAQAEAALAEARVQVQQVRADLAEAAEACADAARSLDRLRDEQAAVAARAASLPAAPAADAATVAAAAALREAERAVAEAQRADIQAAAARHEAARQMAENARLVEALAARHAQARRSLGDGSDADPQACRAAVDAAEAAMEAAEAARVACSHDAASARAALMEAQASARSAAAAAEEAAQREARIGEALAVARAARDAARNAAIDAAEIVAAEAAATHATARAEAARAAMAGAQAARQRAADDLEQAVRAAREAADGRARAQSGLAAERERAAVLKAALDAIDTQLAAAQAALVPQSAQDAAAQALAAAELAEAQARAALERLETAEARALPALAAARAAAAAAVGERARLEAEIEGLRAAIGPPRAHEPALATLEVPEGLEDAVAAALGEALASSLDPAATQFFTALPALIRPLPGGAQPLAELFETPEPLRRALGAVGLIDGDGGAWQAALLPGQSLVRRDGAAWRWDGHVSRGIRRAGAVGLAQRRQLHALQQRQAEATQQVAHADAALQAAEASAQAAAGFLAEGRDALRRHAARAREARSGWHTQDQAARVAKARTDDLALAQGRAALAHRAAQDAAQAAERAWHAAPDAAAFAHAAERARHAGGEAAAAADAARTHAEHARGLAADRVAALTALREAQADAARRLAAAEPAATSLALEHERAVAALAAARAHPLPDLPAAAGAVALAERRADQARTDETTAREARRTALAALHAAEQTASLAAELARADANLAAARTRAAEPADPAIAAALAEATEALTLARSQDGAARETAATLAQQRRETDARLHALAADIPAWAQRLATAQARQTALQARQAAGAPLVARLGAAPARIAGERQGLAAAATVARARHAHAAEALAAAAAAAERAEAARRATADAAWQARAQASRAEAEHFHATAELAAARARAADILGDAPREAADLTEAAQERAGRRVERLTKERDEMGPVNLRAEREAAEIAERLATIAAEREALTTAIAKLRGAIGHLNREGRERLVAAFAEVDGHFRTLFTRVMGGGRAHLALVGDPDPLLAGLELYAEPPGKKLASLSLLSGGEQALTALSLIFAIFRCTPPPIAVLDEVDAPLDDANVERLCQLLDDMARESGTRFLVVTHHPLTMGRMDRLYGVTMQERGVSKILSVDLQRATELVG